LALAEIGLAKAVHYLNVQISGLTAQRYFLLRKHRPMCGVIFLKNTVAVLNF